MSAQMLAAAASKATGTGELNSGRGELTFCIVRFRYGREGVGPETFWCSAGGWGEFSRLLRTSRRVRLLVSKYRCFVANFTLHL